MHTVHVLCQCLSKLHLCHTIQMSFAPYMLCICNIHINCQTYSLCCFWIKVLVADHYINMDCYCRILYVHVRAVTWFTRFTSSVLGSCEFLSCPSLGTLMIEGHNDTLQDGVQCCELRAFSYLMLWLED